MGQQVADGHGPRRGHCDKLRMGAADKHPQVGPGRDKFVYRVVELKQPLLIQHHERHAGDGLAHRIDAKDAVVLHGSCAFEFQIPLRFTIGNLPMTSHERQSAGNFTRIDIALHVGTKAREAL